MKYQVKRIGNSYFIVKDYDGYLKRFAEFETAKDAKEALALLNV